MNSEDQLCIHIDNRMILTIIMLLAEIQSYLSNRVNEAKPIILSKTSKFSMQIICIVF